MGNGKSGCLCLGKNKRQGENSVSEEQKEQVVSNEGVTDPDKEAKAKVIIESEFRKSEIKVSDFTPMGTEKNFMRYNCPICLRYFERILVTKCCKQYICHSCALELKDKDVNFIVTCPHCKSEELHLADVDPKETVRKYSDSPVGTHEKNWANELRVVEEDVEELSMQNSLLFTKQSANMYNTA